MDFREGLLRVNIIVEATLVGAFETEDAISPLNILGLIEETPIPCV